MTPAHKIGAAVARRFLVLRHLLTPPRSLPPERESVMRVLDRLGSLQFDPLEIAGRNHDLVLLARIAGYLREWTDALLYDDRRLFEAYNKGLSILPTAELPYYRIAWDRARAAHAERVFEEHGPLVEELLERIRRDGHLSPADVAPRAAIDWYWRPTNQVRAILEALAEAGVLGIARRDGNRRVYDLTERLLPPALLAERRTEREQYRHKLLSRYRAHGLLGTTGPAELWLGTGHEGAAFRASLRAELVESGTLAPVAVEGIRGDRLVLAAELPLLAEAEREVAAKVPPGGSVPGVTFLAPLDPFVWDRDFLRRLHGFDYVWEVYVPEAKRRWGYYVLPILYGDRLVGRIEPRVDRKMGALSVLGVWWEKDFDPLADDRFTAAFAEALDAHRAFAGLARVALPRTGRRHFTSAVREALARRTARATRSGAHG